MLRGFEAVTWFWDHKEHSNIYENNPFWTRN